MIMDLVTPKSIVRLTAVSLFTTARRMDML